MRLTYFTVAALFHEEIQGATAGVVDTKTHEIVAPKNILAANEDAAKTLLAREFNPEMLGGKVLQQLDRVELFVKRLKS